MPTKFTRKLSDRGDNTCIAFYLPNHYRTQLEEIADQEETTVSAVVRQSIVRYLAKEPDLDEIGAIDVSGATHNAKIMGFWLSNEHREKLTKIAKRVNNKLTLSAMLRLAIAHYLDERQERELAIGETEVQSKKSYTAITAKLLMEEGDRLQAVATEKGVTPACLVRSIVCEFLRSA